MACLFRVPAEVVKQRTQASHFKSSLEAFKFLLKDQNNEGLIRGFYRGWNTTILREIPFTSIQYPLYEFLKKKWAFYEENNKISPLQGATCGSIAGGTAAALTTPLDVLKTRIMLHKERIGLVALTKNLIKEEGFKSLLNGMVPRILWISAGGFIYLGMYETVHFILTERNEINKKLQ
ncbi:hypothetical protein PACTADRAFT_51007 [Pachysolen tannophilus NRRL Y-2460]|uniref:Mitochondrial carrier protein PET8 n=1 Tax=Pachysolen tannophilus NRRL Y-2460 TaxID=669874 RepID=A0A1E4TQT6_PACTA|nr:hypothetical protein PACTADRAFT_51007 [Pachysolen tannophilus NRRL Y-2460]